MTANATIEATPGQVAAIERDGFLVVVGPTMQAEPYFDGDEDGQFVPAPTTKPCPECGGKGTARYPIDNFASVKCNECAGEGTVPIVVEVVVSERACPECNQKAAAFHATYELLASEFGYKTREESAVPWADVPANNKALMRATVAVVTDHSCMKGTIPARTLLRGTAEAVPVLSMLQWSTEGINCEPCLTIGNSGLIYYLTPNVPQHSITAHFADVPRPEVGDTAWIIRGEGS